MVASLPFHIRSNGTVASYTHVMMDSRIIICNTAWILDGHGTCVHIIGKKVSPEYMLRCMYACIIVYACTDGIIILSLCINYSVNNYGSLVLN